ncbi:hypothetical protein LK994_09515 [Ferruginibacter lapsinanis]|uniref:alpha/beta hydrolase n=1 Tax=Ferruginibacter lapsinanis TaxID=563172 RepID=UPI001E2AE049|nr:alpha/beta hydrolase-fold protein [Ferruginibacter lapsinanis]UEG48874.1 hypothetical protein LK994_09515 [Ferruginibacter lapsinanis]
MFVKRISLLSLLIWASFFCFAQKDSCEFILIDTISKGGADYYLASNSNGWNPKDDQYKFKKDVDGTNHLICYFDKGTTLEFKFTKGSWDDVESDKMGADIDNRRLKTDTAKFTIHYVAGWKSGGKLHTASVNVSIIDTAFYIPQLNTTRRITIYLPENYSLGHKRYPVMYMQDGQNVFDDYTSGYGEWGVDECLDTLIRKGQLPCIVVAIDNGPKRINEYTPYTTERFGKGEGDLYVDFLTQTLKPFIDKHYRTLPTRENTIIAGSSLGALIAYYAMLQHPDVYGKAGIFSPAFWVATPSINNLTDSVGSKVSGKLFFYMGEQEGGDDLKLMNDIKDDLATRSSAMIYSVIDREGKHNEKAWRKWFAEFYKWIMADGFNIILKPEE